MRFSHSGQIFYPRLFTFANIYVVKAVVGIHVALVEEQSTLSPNNSEVITPCLRYSSRLCYRGIRYR